MADFLYENINLGSSDAEAALGITATAFTETGVTFDANSSPGDTITGPVFFPILGNAEPPTSITFTSFVPANWTYTSQNGPVATFPFGDYTVYVFEVTLTRVLAQFDSGASPALTAVTVQGRSISTPAIQVTCPA